MRKLGKALHVSSVTKRLIVRSSGQEALQGYVADKTGYVIGRVDEVFGPVFKPYYAVKVFPKVDPSKYIDEELYVAPYTSSDKGSPRNTKKAGRIPKKRFR